MFNSLAPLSDASVNHLIQLLHLRIWHIEGPPPNYSTSSLPLVFPPLTESTLGEGAARGWLSFLGHLEGNASTMQGVTPLSRVKDSLTSLNINDFSYPIIDVSFTTPIQIFRNLVQLWVGVYCPGGEEGGQCTFRLDGDEVAKLAMPLPQLKSLSLGIPCPKNICATTVASLLPISVHCIELEDLAIHFNTTSIVDDFGNISKDPKFRELRSLPRCTLSYSLTQRCFTWNSGNNKFFSEFTQPGNRVERGEAS